MIIMLPFNKKKNHATKGGGNKILKQKQRYSIPSRTGYDGNKILIKINVMGSAGPIRFVVDEKAVVATVIETALKAYAREDRLPVLGTKFSDFFLYTPIAGTEALSPWEMIGSFGVRNFRLCKKQVAEGQADITRKSSGSSLKSWFNKSLVLKLLLINLR